MLPRLRPRNFYDLAIEVASVRPGPVQWSRQGFEPVTYPSEAMKRALSRTLGSADLSGTADAGGDAGDWVLCRRGGPAAPRHGPLEAQRGSPSTKSD